MCARPDSYGSNWSRYVSIRNEALGEETPGENFRATERSIVRLQECFEAVNTNMFSTMMQSYKLWPAAHIINFAFVPSDFRVLYINTIAVSSSSRRLNTKEWQIAWSVIMIGQTQGAGPPTEVEAIHTEILA